MCDMKRTGTGSRTEQVSARVDPARMGRIRYASALQSSSVSAFMVDAAYQKAEEVIAEKRTTLVPTDYFDRLIAALDEPPRVIPELAAAAKAVAAEPAFKQS